MQVKAATYACRLGACSLLDLEQEDTTMSQSVELPESVYAALEAAASAAGTTPAEWIAAQLPEPEAQPEREEEAPRTLAERFEGYLGLVSLDRTDLAERASELFGEGMVEKHRAGQL
jgi:hypothetical protein